ncbi:hypothetical protein X798_04393 [Onchocerca flexuosa]|uniref:Uncharacterized protein n=1 Tax=Onchocerca flexuosa TaxID=387005 RepID=A0A238BV63_9BILA|nr:hypothetical protein X798_04393 [Onchocerca flexuosa]
MEQKSEEEVLRESNEVAQIEKEYRLLDNFKEKKRNKIIEVEGKQSTKKQQNFIRCLFRRIFIELPQGTKLQRNASNSYIIMFISTDS